MAIFPSHALRCWLLSDRSNYQTCHIRLPDGESLSAIAINSAYYGFRRRLMSSAQTLKLLYTLSDPSSSSPVTDVALTTNVKGSYFLWVREPYAIPKGNFVSTTSAAYQPITFLKLPEGTPFAKISVPDLDQALSSIAFENNYYSIFKIEEDPEAVLGLVDKLSQRGDEVLVAATSEGSAICVLEAEAVAV